jgi:hypothetical protein
MVILFLIFLRNFCTLKGNWVKLIVRKILRQAKLGILRHGNKSTKAS